MGQAKQRGTFEERKAQAMQRGTLQAQAMQRGTLQAQAMQVFGGASIIDCSGSEGEDVTKAMHVFGVISVMVNTALKYSPDRVLSEDGNYIVGLAKNTKETVANCFKISKTLNLNHWNSFDDFSKDFVKAIQKDYFSMVHNEAGQIAISISQKYFQ